MANLRKKLEADSARAAVGGGHAPQSVVPLLALLIALTNFTIFFALFT